MAMRARYMLLALSLLPLVGCDYATKQWAETSLRGAASIPIVPDVFELSYAQNFDVAFNALRAIPAPARFVLILAVGVTLVVLLALLALRLTRLKRPGYEAFAYALLLAGALGNLADRVARGYVVDFMHLSHWPVFNFADVWIVLGAALLLWSARAHSGRGDAPTTRKASAPT